MDDIYFEELSPEEGFHCHETDYAGSAWHVRPHWHYYIEVVYIAAGRAGVYVNGASHVLHAGDFVFIDSLMIHSFYGESDWGTRIVVVKFNKQLLLPPSQFAEPLFQQLMSTDHRLFDFGLRFPREEAAADDMPALIRSISREFGERRFGYELAVRTKIGQLFLWIIRKREQQYRRLGGQGQERQPFYAPLMRMIAHIATHYREPLDARAAARQCNMSYSYFSRKFKLVAGRTFSEHLNFVRVMEAEKLLIGTTDSITAIAMDVGFANTSYFIKQFRKVRSISPLQYRKRLVRTRE